MSSPVAAEEFKDMASHKAMWDGYTRLLVRGITLVLIVILFIGFITGVL